VPIVLLMPVGLDVSIMPVPPGTSNGPDVPDGILDVVAGTPDTQDALCTPDIKHARNAKGAGCLFNATYARQIQQVCHALQ